MKFPANPFVKKGFGRIYVTKAEDIKFVEKTIKQLDSFEWEYYPKGLTQVFEGKVELIFTHKFEIDMDALTEVCWQRGVWIWCISQRDEDWLGRIVYEPEEEE
jgi:hypothetical protein